MARTVACPRCGAQFQLDAPQPGRRYECPGCQSVFQVKAPKSRPESRALDAAAADKRIQRENIKPGGKAFRSGQAATGSVSRPRPAGAEIVSPARLTPPGRPRLLVAVGLVVLAVAAAGGSTAWWLSGGQSKVVPQMRPAQSHEESAAVKEERPNPTLKGEEIYRRLLKSTVWVYVPNGDESSSGSGQVVDTAHRWVLTNYHVVGDVKEVVVFFPDYENGEPISRPRHYVDDYKRGRDPDGGGKSKLSVKGNVVHKDVGKDLVVIALEGIPDNVQEVAIGAEKPRASQTVFSIGASGVVNSAREDGALWRSTEGRVSQVYERDFKYAKRDQRVNAWIVETTLPTNAGDSGAAIVNEHAEMVGLVAARDPEKEAVSLGIEIREIENFLQQYYKSAGVTYVRPGSTRSEGRQAALGSLIRGLNDPDAAVRVRSAESLGELEGDARPAIRHLLDLVNDDNPDVRRAVNVALDKMKAPADVDLPYLYKALEDQEHVETRRRAARLLALTKITRDGLATALLASNDPDPTVRENIMIVLGHYSDDMLQVLPRLLSRLREDQEKDLAVRRQALSAATSLVQHESFREQLSPEMERYFTSLVDDKDPGVRSLGASGLLFFMDTSHPRVVEIVFEKLLADPSQRVRKFTGDHIDQLKIFERLDGSVLPVLLKAARSPFTEARAVAVAAMGSDRFAPSRKEVLSPLIELLRTEDDEAVRLRAVQGLVKFGREASAGVPALSRQMRARTAELRRLSAGLLKSFGHQPGVVPAMLVALADDDGEVRRVAEDALEDMSPLDPEDVADLEGALRSTNENVRAHAAVAAGKIGPAAKAAVPALMRCADKNSEKVLAVRVRAVAALSNLGPVAKASAPLLATVLTEPFAEGAALTASPAAFDDVRVYERALKSTVWIVGDVAGGRKIGTGSLISFRQKLVLTNYHVVDGVAGVTVYFADFDKENKPIQETEHYDKNSSRLGIRGRVIPGTGDLRRDLALIQLEKVPPGAAQLPLASASPRPGQQVLSIGSSGAGTGALWRNTPGKVRSVIDDASLQAPNGATVRLRTVETDSPVNRGDSGGPVVNGRGELVAVVKAYLVNQRSVSWFIDIKEVWGYLEALKQSPQQSGFRWEELTPTARHALGGTGNELKCAAATALGRFKLGPGDPGTDSAIRALVSALKDKDASVRASAVTALGELRELAADAVLDIVNLLRDSEIDSGLIVEGLSRLGEKAVKPLSRILIEKYPEPVQLGVALALGKMGPMALAAKDNLFYCSQHNRSKEVRRAAHDAFKQVERGR